MVGYVCLVLFAFEADEQARLRGSLQGSPEGSPNNARLVVAANRDEFYARPASGAHHWEDAPNVFAGRDLQAGGTWLGVTTSGRFAAVTNFTENPEGPEPPLSRGDLTATFLKGKTTAMDYAGGIDGQLYRGFSLLVFDGDSLVYACNRDGPPRYLAPGIHGLANTHLDTDDHWPKVIHGRRALHRATSGNCSPRRLVELLADDWVPPDDELPKRGNTVEFERRVAPCFIRGEDYGTRASTAVIIGAETIEFAEQLYGPMGEVGELTTASFPRIR